MWCCRKETKREGLEDVVWLDGQYGSIGIWVRKGYASRENLGRSSLATSFQSEVIDIKNVTFLATNHWLHPKVLSSR